MNSKMFRNVNTNDAGGSAYKFDDRHALAQYALTGCFSNTYYSQAEEQLDKVKGLCNSVTPDYLAKLAIYSRFNGKMKDMPAFLLANLTIRYPELVKKVFNRVIDNGKMLRNYVQVLRSGVLGRKSLGSVAKNLVQKWLSQRTDDQIFFDSIGNDPSLVDVIKLSHSKPETNSRKALYAYLLKKEYVFGDLPEIVKKYELFKKDRGEIPKVPFRFLDSLGLTDLEWTEIAKTASWETTRMNLNTFKRHGVFNSPEMVSLISERLSNRDLVNKCNVFPYQLYSAYVNNTTENAEINKSLEAALNFSLENVPAFDGNVYVLVDVSGSMDCSITGTRKEVMSKITCVEVAALFASVLFHNNTKIILVPFNTQVISCNIPNNSTVFETTKQIRRLCGGGTDCSAGLKYINENKYPVDLVVMISDNESWVNSQMLAPAYNRGFNGGNSVTQTLQAWDRLKNNNPDARLVCLDITPNSTTQAIEREDILNIGGFSDQVFDIISFYAKGLLLGNGLVDVINTVEI